MIFLDRLDAGRELAKQLEKYNSLPDTLIVALPRGGVITALPVAEKLHLPLDVTCPRKIGFPSNPEFAIGAITETGKGILHDELIEKYQISKEYIDQTIEAETLEAQKRVKLFRGDAPPLNVWGKIVIIVDDGLATGSTMEAAIESIQASNPKKIIVAIPVAAEEPLEKIRSLSDELICLHTPSDFQAVGQFYQTFDQTEDQEVIEILDMFRKEQSNE